MDYCRVCGTASMDYFCGTDCAFKDRLNSTPLKNRLEWIKYIINNIKEEYENYYLSNSTCFDPIDKNLELLIKEEENPTPEERKR